MEEFIDANGFKVQVRFEPHSFRENAKHVLVICLYRHQWLLTHHKTRGLEFPGGKIESGESPEEAAIREVLEETGAIIGSLSLLGAYKVSDVNGPFVKKVFLAFIDHLKRKEDYLETNGPVLVEKDVLLKERLEPQYSFILKDPMIELFIKKIESVT
jgi:8-oxo-dGTP diphosphatase